MPPEEVDPVPVAMNVPLLVASELITTEPPLTLKSEVLQLLVGCIVIDPPVLTVVVWAKHSEVVSARNKLKYVLISSGLVVLSVLYVFLALLNIRFLFVA